MTVRVDVLSCRHRRVRPTSVARLPVRAVARWTRTARPRIGVPPVSALRSCCRVRRAARPINALAASASMACVATRPVEAVPSATARLAAWRPEPPPTAFVPFSRGLSPAAPQRECATWSRSARAQLRHVPVTSSHRWRQCAGWLPAALPRRRWRPPAPERKWRARRCRRRLAVPTRVGRARALATAARTRIVRRASGAQPACAWPKAPPAVPARRGVSA